jgi:hypothetical protein
VDPISWLCGGANKNTDKKVKRANEEASLDPLSWLCGGANKNADMKVREPIRRLAWSPLVAFVGSQ